MEEGKLIKDILCKFEGDIYAQIYQAIKHGYLNETRFRNLAIISEFDNRRHDMPIMGLYTELSKKYHTSQHTIIKVIQERHLNEL